MVGFTSLPAAEEDGREDSQLTGISKILGPKWAQAPVLTVGLLGVSVLWSVEMSYASPYLLSLGLKKYLMAIVFLAGPLSGLVVQPLVGVLTDSSQSRFGRRRPYMLAGVAICVFGVFLLGFTREFASIFAALESYTNDVLTIWMAILAIYCMDFAVNAVQAVDRALLVDALPTSEQASGNAWAARMLGIGSVAGFFVGNIDLTQIFPLFGKTELQVLAVITSFLLMSTHAATAYCVKEKILKPSSKYSQGTLRARLKSLWDNMLNLPSVIRQICIIQFFAWLGWFPILFYTTVYIGEIHKRSSPPPVDEDAAAALEAEGTRLGTRAMLFNSIVSLMTTFILPFFVVREGGKKSVRNAEGLFQAMTRWRPDWKIHMSTLWAASHLLFTICMAATVFTSSVEGATVLMAVVGISWAITQWAPFSLLGEAIHSGRSSFAEDVDSASIRLSDTRSGSSSEHGLRDANEEERQLLVDDDDGLERASDGMASNRSSMSNDDENTAPRRIALMQHSGARISILNVNAADDFSIGADRLPEEVGMGSETGDLSSKAGVILGIHNIFIVIPQFLVTGLSSIIFAIFDPEKSVLHGHHPGNTQSNTGNTSSVALGGNSGNDTTFLIRRQSEDVQQADGPNSVAIIFRIGGVAAAIAFVLGCRLSRDMRRR